MTAALSFYQWLSGKEETRIAAAIEASRKVPSNEIINAINEASIGEVLSDDDAFAALTEINRLEYIAYLTNRGRIEREYMSIGLSCLMTKALQASQQLSKQKSFLTGIKYPELVRLSSGPDANCVTMPRQPMPPAKVRP